MASFADRCAGSLLGLGLADALGAPYEGWSTESTPWKPMPMTRRGTMLYTDDTDMAMGSALSIVACNGFSVDHMARVWAQRAEPARGYGGGAIRCLQNIAQGMPWNEASYSVYPDGSYGNGAAMRVAPLALLFCNQPEQMNEAVALASSVTHSHSLGIQGAQIIAIAVAAATRTADRQAVFDAVIDGDWEMPHLQRLRIAETKLEQEPNHHDVASILGNGIAAHESVTSALLVACWFLDRPFADMIGFIVSVGGDVDTIGAMAGAIWGACRGIDELPDPPLQYLEDREELEALARRIALLSS